MGNVTVVTLLVLSCFFASGLITGCHTPPIKEENSQMELDEMLSAVRNERVQFATMRPPGSAYAVLERQVVVTAPPELVQLSQTGELRVLDELVELLRDPDRAWAAEVLLAAMTRREEKMVDTFATMPDQWWESAGQTAYQRWHTWLAAERDKLVWDSENNVFVVKQE